MGNDRVVLLAVHPDRMFGARVGAEGSVALFDIHSDRILPRVLGKKALRDCDVVQRVTIDEGLRRLPRIVRRVEGDIQEERLLAGFCIVHEANRVIGDNFAPVLAALPEAAELRVGR